MLVIFSVFISVHIYNYIHNPTAVAIANVNRDELREWSYSFFNTNTNDADSVFTPRCSLPQPFVTLLLAICAISLIKVKDKTERKEIMRRKRGMKKIILIRERERGRGCTAMSLNMQCKKPR